MFAVVLGLIALVGWGASDYTINKFSNKIEPMLLNLMYSVSGLIIASALTVVYGLPDFTLEYALPFVVATVALALGLFTLMRAFSAGAVGVVAPIMNSYILITALLAFVFLGEKVSVVAWFGAALIVLGIGAITYSPTHAAGGLASRKTILWSLLTMLIFGVGYFMYGVGAKQEWHANMILFRLVDLPFSIGLYLWYVRERRKEKFVAALKTVPLYYGTIPAGLATLAVFIAADVAGGVSVPIVISGGSALFTSFLAFAIDKEHLRLRYRVGAIIAVAGIMMVSF